MITTKTRTIVITAIASLCVAGTAVAPTVSQAEPVATQTEGNAGGCGGGSSYGDVVEHKNVTVINGKTTVIETWTEVCGKDGKWHKTLNEAPPAPEAPVLAPKTVGTTPVGIKAAA